jgi:tetratricopeptide (TPR) repeat protein
VTLPAIVIAAALAAATSVHFPVSTNDPQAQTAIDRGLFLYYAYNGDGAARSFAEAASREPGLAVAFWGIALAAGPDLNTPLTAAQFAVAQRASRHAVELSAGASERERSFVAIMARRYAGTFKDWNADDDAYRQAMTAFAQSSHDENAQLLAAEALLEHGGLAWENGRLSSGESRTALELDAAVLRDDPSNVMANHLCIHLYDLAPDRLPALPCAQRLDAATFPAQAEHLAHMPAHYWIETGGYRAALASSERAYALLLQLEGTNEDAEHVGRYLKHDVAVGYSAAMMLGNYATAQLWSARMDIAYNTSFDALTALRFGRYSEAYAAPDSAYGNPAVRGLAALHLGRNKEADAIAKPMIDKPPASGYLPQLFLAREAEASGRFGEARTWIADAARDQGADFSGELIPLLPAQEALGFLELRRGDASEAIAAFTQTLALYPNDPRALFGLASALAAGDQNAAAEATRARFAREWEGADTGLAGADLP